LISRIKLVQFAQIPGETVVNDDVVGGALLANCRIHILAENKGRRPLRFVELCVEKHSGVSLPLDPVYTNIRPWRLVLEKGTWLRPDDQQAVITAPDVNAAAAAYRAGGAFWVYGYIGYRDLLNNTAKHRFLARWDLTNGFVPDARPGYT